MAHNAILIRNIIFYTIYSVSSVTGLFNVSPTSRYNIVYISNKVMRELLRFMSEIQNTLTVIICVMRCACYCIALFTPRDLAHRSTRMYTGCNRSV